MFFIVFTIYTGGRKKLIKKLSCSVRFLNVTQRVLRVFSARFFNRVQNFSQRFLHDHLFAKWAPGNVFCTFSKRFLHVFYHDHLFAKGPRVRFLHVFYQRFFLSFSRTTPSFSTRFLKRFRFVVSRETIKKKLLGMSSVKTIKNSVYVFSSH